MAYSYYNKLRSTRSRLYGNLPEIGSFRRGEQPKGGFGVYGTRKYGQSAVMASDVVLAAEKKYAVCISNPFDPAGDGAILPDGGEPCVPLKLTGMGVVSFTATAGYTDPGWFICQLCPRITTTGVGKAYVWVDRAGAPMADALTSAAVPDATRTISCDQDDGKDMAAKLADGVGRLSIISMGLRIRNITQGDSKKGVLYGGLHPHTPNTSNGVYVTCSSYAKDFRPGTRMTNEAILGMSVRWSPQDVESAKEEWDLDHINFTADVLGTNETISYPYDANCDKWNGPNGYWGYPTIVGTRCDAQTFSIDWVIHCAYIGCKSTSIIQGLSRPVGHHLGEIIHRCFLQPMVSLGHSFPKAKSTLGRVVSRITRPKYVRKVVGRKGGYKKRFRKASFGRKSYVKRRRFSGGRRGYRFRSGRFGRRYQSRMWRRSYY